MRIATTPLVAVVLGGLFAMIYADALGHGFVKDDFRWVAAAEIRSAGDIERIFSTNIGFYRPLVTMTFAIDRGIWSLDPRGYAITNVILLLANCGLLFALARRFSLPPAPALFAVGTWAFNLHGINMALLWISGRTELLLCLFSLAAVHASVRGRYLAAGALTFAAMLCKEEAVMLPALLVVSDSRRVLRRSWPLWTAAAVYLVLRNHSGAFGLSDAPPYYRLTFDPRTVLKNAGQYLDRAATLAMVAAALMFAATPGGTRLNDAERRTVRFGLVWFAFMFALTVFVPVRSSLYAVAPSMGSALVAAACASRAQRIAPYRFARVCAALIAVVAVLIPIYRMRNHGLIEPADLSRQAIAAMKSAQADSSVREIVLIDDADAAVTLEDAFGALAPDAVHLFVAGNAVVRIARAREEGNDGALVFVLRGGRLVQERQRTSSSPADTRPSH